MTQPKDNKRLDQILGQLAGASSLCWEPKPTGVFDPQQANEFVKEAESDLIDLFIEIVGEDETVMKPDYAMGRNELRKELRQAINHLRGEV